MKSNWRNIGVEALESRMLLAGLGPSPIDPQLPPRFSMPLDSAPLHSEDVQEIRAMEVRLRFDPAVVQTTSDRVFAGSAWANKANVVANVNQEAGTIVAFVFSANPLPEIQGSLLEIESDPTNATSPGTFAAISIELVKLNEHTVDWETSLMDESLWENSDLAHGQTCQMEVSMNQGTTDLPAPNQYAPNQNVIDQWDMPLRPSRPTDRNAGLLGLQDTESQPQAPMGPLLPRGADSVFANGWATSAGKSPTDN